MRQVLALFCFAIFSAFCGVVLAPATAQAQDALQQCTAYPRIQETYECFCPPMSEAYGTVWGSGPYTADSDVCMAALHYGVIGQEGGNVRAYIFPGTDQYDASFANGVQSSFWRSYHTSMMFEPFDQPLDEQPIKAGGPVRACAGFPDTADILTCTCTPQATAKGTFWGNDPYTIDSDICIAARHSGIIEADGGTVTAIRVIGLEDYTSSLNNGVESQPSGPFPSSMVFDRN